jgi:solute carrier family 8 (sodium/calcium exchanger)
MQNKANIWQERSQNLSEAVVGFTTQAVTVLESESQIQICVQRSGKLDNSFICEIETLDRTAIANCDYITVKETVKFESQETEKKIAIKIISTNEWSPDKVFLVKLNLPNNQLNKGVVKGDISIMQVTIVDDDEPGIIEFVQRMIVVADSENMAYVPLIRCQGSDGEVRVKWKTVDGSAKNGLHYYGGEGEIIFGPGIIKKDIEIPIISHFEEEKEEYFELILIEATAGALIGKINRVMVTITDDRHYDLTLKKIMPKLNYTNTFELHREEWFDQIKDAFTFGDSQNNNYNQISTLEYILHFLSFGWKVSFSLLPPTRLCNFDSISF